MCLFLTVFFSSTPQYTEWFHTIITEKRRETVVSCKSFMIVLICCLVVTQMKRISYVICLMLCRVFFLCMTCQVLSRLLISFLVMCESTVSDWVYSPCYLLRLLYFLDYLVCQMFQALSVPGNIFSLLFEVIIDPFFAMFLYRFG